MPTRKFMGQNKMNMCEQEAHIFNLVFKRSPV